MSLAMNRVLVPKNRVDENFDTFADIPDISDNNHFSVLVLKENSTYH